MTTHTAAPEAASVDLDAIRAAATYLEDPTNIAQDHVTREKAYLISRALREAERQTLKRYAAIIANPRPQEHFWYIWSRAVPNGPWEKHVPPHNTEGHASKHLQELSDNDRLDCSRFYTVAPEHGPEPEGAGFFLCDGCNTETPNSEAHESQATGRSLCLVCADTEAETGSICNVCEEMYPLSELSQAESRDGACYVCHDCLDGRPIPVGPNAAKFLKPAPANKPDQAETPSDLDGDADAKGAPRMRVCSLCNGRVREADWIEIDLNQDYGQKLERDATTPPTFSRYVYACPDCWPAVIARYASMPSHRFHVWARIPGGSWNHFGRFTAIEQASAYAAQLRAIPGNVRNRVEVMVSTNTDPNDNGTEPEPQATDWPPPLYYDYQLQLWVKDGKVQDCAHPGECPGGTCNARKYAGRDVTTIPGHQDGWPPIPTQAEEHDEENIPPNPGDTRTPGEHAEDLRAGRC